jgi:lipopolysaccharide export system permease protein
MKKLKLLNLYIAKNFLIKFLQVTAGFSLLIFFINLIDTTEKIRGTATPFYIAAGMAFLQIPDFLNDVVPSLVLISAIITFFLLSSKSEITIFRISGFSLWQIIFPVASSAIILGIFWITAFGQISIYMSKKFTSLEGKYIKNEMREVVAPQNGIWLKQANNEIAGEELIIQAKKVYKENLELDEVTVWFFNKNGQFYKKIDAETMLMKENYWLLENATLNDFKSLNKKINTVTIKTDLRSDFVMQKIVNNFQNEKLFSIFALPHLIEDLQSAGFDSRKFKIYLNSLLSKPLLFLAMTLIACYFGLGHIRNQNSILMIFLGVVCGLVFYITSSIVNALGASGLIPIFASTWIIALICLAIGTLLIFHKESL